MKFSENDMQPIWDEVMRIIGEAVLALHRQAEPLTINTLTEHLEHQRAEAPNTQNSVLIATAITLLKKPRCH
jgi:hypothetical protein